MFRFLESLFSGGYDPKKEILELRESIQELLDQLIKWDETELELLSLAQVERKISRRGNFNLSGIVDSIYHEHMLAYAYRRVKSNSKRALLYANSKSHEFFYIINNGSAQIYVDQYFLGTLNPEGLLYGKKRNRLIARINDIEKSTKPIIIGDKEAAVLLDPINNDKFNPRAFEYINENLSHSDFLISLALGIYVIIDKTKDLKKLN